MGPIGRNKAPPPHTHTLAQSARCVCQAGSRFWNHLDAGGHVRSNTKTRQYSVAAPTRCQRSMESPPGQFHQDRSVSKLRLLTEGTGPPKGKFRDEHRPGRHDFGQPASFAWANLCVAELLLPDPV
eukprot:354523-Chlamydomonas_euryale.AAC.3